MERPRRGQRRDRDPIRARRRAIERKREAIETAKRDIASQSGVALLDFIRADSNGSAPPVRPSQHAGDHGGMEATWWLNDQLQAWLGEKNAADTLTAVRPAQRDLGDGPGAPRRRRRHPSVPGRVAFLEQTRDDDFLEALPALAGGSEAREATWPTSTRTACAASVDHITRPRWIERPITLVPIILDNIRNFEPGAGRRLFEQGRDEALTKEHELLERLRREPDGEDKAAQAKRMIDRVRTFAGYREYPKYHMVSRYLIYKQALLEPRPTGWWRTACSPTGRTSSSSGSTSWTASSARSVSTSG